MGRSKQYNRKRDAARRQEDEADGIVRHPPARSFLYPTRDHYQSIFRILPSDDPEILEFEMISDRFPHDLPPWRRFDFRRDRPPPNHGRERWKEIVAVPDGPPRVLSNRPVRVTRVPQMQVPLSQGQDRLVSLLTRYFYERASEHVKRRVFLFRPQWMFFLGCNDIANVSHTVNFHSSGRDPFDSLLVAPMLVNANHWAVVLGVNLDKLVHRPSALPARPDVADPPMFIVFDSGTNYRTHMPTAARYPALVGLNRYLRQRAIDDPIAHSLNARYMLHDAWRDQPFFATGSNFSQASWPIVVMAEMPLQRDGYNCGMHAVQCVRSILERDLDFLREICRLPVGRMFCSIDQTLFHHENMSVLRLEFLKLIMNLMDQCMAYCKDRISIQQRDIILNRVHAHDLAVAQQFAEVYQQQLRDDPEVFLSDLDFG
ncbi:hypothetical protein GGF31_001150 [Allomyces arbusculus]|nr:hypothetical protein GGF31_001150 [Allomyces arbusculus]